MRVVVVACLALLLLSSSAFAQADPSNAQPEPADQVEQLDQADQLDQVDQLDQADQPGADDAAEQQPQPDLARNLSFFLAADLDGRLADIDCRRDDVLRPRDMHYARQVAYYRQLVEGARSMADQPIPLNLGDSTFPGTLPRYLLTSEEGAIDFAATLDQIPYRAHVLGDDEFGMQRSQLLNFIEGARRVDLPLQAANLACSADGGAEAICEATGTGPEGEPWQILEHAGLEIGVISVLDPDVQKGIAKTRAAGLDFLEPEEVLGKLVGQVRDEGGADLVVVLYHMVGSLEGDDAVELASSVDGIDLMFTNRLLTAADSAGDTSNNGFVMAPRTGTFVVGASTGNDRAVSVDVELTRAREGESWRAASLRTRIDKTDQIEPDPTTATMLDDLAGWFCEDWGKPINPDLALAHPFSREDLQRFILNVMRFSTDAEVALVNSATFVDTGVFPIGEQLTLADIITFMPYGNQLYTVSVPGEVLASLAARLGGDLTAAGMEKQGDKVLVNGRAIQTGRNYRVATHGYVAGGGDDILPQDRVSNAERFKPDWTDEAPAIGTVVAEAVRTADFHDNAPSSERLDPQANFPDLYRKFLWGYTGSINASFNRVDVDNPGGGYDQSQLNVNSTTQVNLEGNGSIRADSRNHGWENRLLVQYAQARVSADENGERDFEETKDLIRYRSIYQYAGFRADAGGEWYVPMPFAELQVESEFSSPNERDWHKVELTGIGGAKFQLFDPLEIKLGANARRDINHPGGETTYGLNAGYVLNRFDLIDLLGKPLQFESELEYFYNDIGQNNIQELRNTNRVYFALLDQLFFTTTFQAFMYKNDDVGEFGSNTELTVGLNYLWDATVQSF